MIPQGFLQDLLARADIVDVVGRAVQLKKAGSNYKGLCPFHGEKSASFNVNPVRQTYHCFGCGVHGDALRFLMEHAGLSFVEAVRELAGELGMPIPEDEASPQDREREQRQREQRRTLGDVLARAMTHYRQQLKASPRAIEYLKGRGLTGEIAARFGLGYAPGGWHGLSGAFGQYDDPLLVEAGLVILQDKDDAGHTGSTERRRYDRFRDRVMFPIRNVRGEVIGFGGRVLDQGEPKYLNSPETPVFVKGRELYGLFEARVGLRNRGYALVTEGYMDVVALAQLGFENAVATLGTACTAEHVAKLLKFTEQVVFSFDGDAAGRRAAARAMEAVLPHATDTRSFRFLFLPTEHDPDSFVREFGAEAFEARVREALPLSRQLLDLAADGCDLATPEGRARMLATARPWFEQMPEGLLREQLRAELARAGGVSDEVLANHWRQHGQRGGTGSARRDEAAASPPASQAAPWGPDDGRWSAEPDPSAGHAPRHDEASRGDRSGARSGSGRNWKDWKDWKDQNGHRSGGRWRDRADQPPMPSRPLPRATDLPDRAAWLLLRHCGLWLALSAEVHDELVHLPAPHGELFAALERVLHDQGALAMPELLDALRHEADGIDALTHLLERLRGLHDIEDDADPLTEVLIVVMRLRLHELDEQIRLLASSPLQDSTERDRFRELQQTQQRMQVELQALRTQSKPDRI